MYNLNLSKEQFSDFLNLFYKVFYPVEKFVNKEQFLKKILKNKFKRYFFSFPIYFGVNKLTYNKIKNEKIVSLYFKKNIYLKLKI